jgi:hypothetical protein
VHLQATEQVVQATGLQQQRHVVAQDQRSQQVLLEIPRQRGHGPHPQHLPPGAATLAQVRQQLVACREDRLGISHRDPTRLGQLQRTGPALEQRLPEGFLQLLDLR